MNNNEKESRYSYSDSEKETLKVLKMQERELDSLAANTSTHTSELEDIRKRAERIAARLNVSIKPKTENVEVKPYQIHQEEIPSWESLVNRANQEIDDDIILEDLLSKEEFNYCIEDVRRINEEFSQKTSIRETYHF